MIKFGTGGIRGVISDEFTKDTVLSIAQAICNISVLENKHDKPIAVGYDNRFMSDTYAVWMSEVFVANGIKVLLYSSPVPTPAVMYLTKDRQLNYGVMITASHNPYIYNGVKVFLYGGIDANKEFTDKLSEIANKIKEIKSIEFSQCVKTKQVKYLKNINQYLDNIRSFLSPKIEDSSIKILHDNLNGVGYIGLKQITKMLNIMNYHAMNIKRDAFFNFGEPNPLPQLLTTLRKRVVKEKFDIGIATDGDADRLGVIDEKGNYVNSHMILGCLYYYLVKIRGEKGDIVRNFSTSILMDKLADKLGYKCYETDTGFKNISAKMLETDALIGGEGSGGLTIRNYILGKDSVFSSMLFIEMCIVMNKTVSQIVEEVCNFASYSYHVEEQEVAFPHGDRWQEIKHRDIDFGIPVKEKQFYGENIKYKFDDDMWLVIRKSGTEPVLRFVCEMSSEDISNELINIAKKQILDII